MSDQRFPNEEERSLISNGVVITKLKLNSSNIQPFYHKWRDIWDENKSFKIVNANPEYTFRALAVTMPMYFLDDPNVTEFTYKGYIAGLKTEGVGDVQIFILSQIIWLE